MGVSGASLGISGGEDGVDQDECTDDFSPQACAFRVAEGELVRTAAVLVVVGFLERFH